jgi:undecaprenyl diphosphate synthase
MEDAIPRHVGIIMDGNGRWANLRGLPRIEGHRQGSLRTKDIINAAADIGVNILTLYAFSIENWKRPQTEVYTLMELLDFYLKTEITNIFERGISFKVIGDRERLSRDIREMIDYAEDMTGQNTGMRLLIAISYGGRDEILRAARKLIASGREPSTLCEADFEACLDTAGQGPVDLIIRTGGEKRISNFLVWQAAYAELHFTDTLWPDFTRDEFFLALQSFRRRERRFGSATEKVYF